MKKGAIILIIFLFNSALSIPQQENFAFKNINTSNGLSQNSVVDIVEDETGFMWFATQDGLNRFDGINFLVFPVSFDDITTSDNVRLGKLLANNNTILLIKKGGKLQIFNLFTQTFSDFVFPGMSSHESPPVSSIFVDKDEGLWIGTISDGVYNIDKHNNLRIFSSGSTGAERLLSNSIRSIFQETSGNIWVLSNGGATELNGTSSKDHLGGLNTNVLVEGPERSFWLGTLGQGIYYKKGNSIFEPFNGFGNQRIPENLVIETMLVDDQNRIWVGTYGNGLFIIDPSSEMIHHLLPDRKDPFSLGFQDILSLKKDKKGGIWLGTDGGGISYFNRQFSNFKSITVRNVDPNISIEQVRSIVTDENRVIWLGTSGQGLTSFDQVHNTFKTFHLKPYKPGVSNYDRIISLQTDNDGDLWIGTQGNGLLIFDTKKETINKWFTTDCPEISGRIDDNTIWKILPEKNGQMWIATRNAGLALVDKELGVVKSYQLGKKSGNESGINIESILRIDKSTLVVSLEHGDLYFFHIPTEKFTALGNEKVKKIRAGETDIKSMFFEEDWLWLGTAGKGIIITNIKTGKTFVVDDKNWLPNNVVYAILPERKGIVWISSNKGLFRLYYTTSNNRFNINRISSYTVADGLQNNEFNTGASYRSSDGQLFFGGISGLNYFNPSDIPYDQGNNSIVLTDALVGKSRLAGDTVITYKSHLNLSHYQNSFSFNYTALDFISPENLNYQYMLAGYDESWIDAGTRNYAAYTNLPPNDYVFNVRVSNKTSVEAPLTSLFISIAVPFWKQDWFISLVVIMIIIVIYFLHRYRVYQLLQVQKVKNTISADLHDDLGARLTNIQMLNSISKLKFSGGNEEKKYLEGIEEELEASAKALDEIVWNIKMKDESLEEIVAKMRSYAVGILEKEYNYKIKISGKFCKKRMSMQKRRELFLVFKELLNNIRKHSCATKVKINITIEDGMFLLAIEDNGKGFDPEKLTQRNGLRNIKERVRRWNGLLKLGSVINKGTQVSLKVPFDNHWSPFY